MLLPEQKLETSRTRAVVQGKRHRVVGKEAHHQTMEIRRGFYSVLARV